MKKANAMHSFWRILAPRQVSLVTCIDKEGKANIISVAWSVPLSINPPLVAIVIGKDRYSHKLLKEVGEYVINIPSEELKKEVEICGTISGRSVNKFERTGLTPIEAKKVKPPVIKECIAHVECKVVNEVPAGDHTIFIGRVVSAYANDYLFDVKWNLAKERRPLLHVGGRTYAKAEGL